MLVKYTQFRIFRWTRGYVDREIVNYFYLDSHNFGSENGKNFYYKYNKQ